MFSPEAEKRIQEWLSGPVDAATKNEILRLQKEDPLFLNDVFSSTLTFGTGGMRGVMGVGSNRMNLYTVQMATQGLANYLLKTLKTPHSVFISFDNRHHSEEYAWIAARVLAGNGIGSYVTKELRPTPYVSFGVRQKKCSAGIMLTASHNPKEYNGYKVYWSDGGQVVYPHDDGIVAEVAKIKGFNQIKLGPEKSPLIEIVGNEFDNVYLDAIHKLQIDPKEDAKVGDQLKITYTPLHGTGNKLAPRALMQWGFSNINLVDHQIVPDGDFPTVKSPNPENAEALSMGIKQLQDTRSDILIANDPDADRMAVVVLHQERPYTLSGNQIACICLEYIGKILKEQKRLPKNGAAVTTIVSTDLFPHICQAYNIACFEVLTGFKYIGELIHKWEQDQSQTFLFGAEESYGFLIGTHSRDKDAIVSSCLIAEIALHAKIAGKTLLNFLEEIYKKYGFFYESQRSIGFPPGQAGMEKMFGIMNKLRKERPSKILNTPIKQWEDYKPGFRNLPPSDVLLFRLEDNTKIVIRPSGTEPKLKIYGGVLSPTFKSYEEGIQASQQKMNRIFDDIQTLF